MRERPERVHRRDLILCEVQRISVGASRASSRRYPPGQRIERILDEVAAHGEERPCGPIRVLRSVAAEVAGDLPAVDHLAHLRLFVADRLLSGGDAFVYRLAGIGVEHFGRELRAGFDAELGETSP